MPGPLASLGSLLTRRIGRLPVPVPVLVPALPVQLVHEEDLGRALLQCVIAAGPPGACNIAADGIATPADLARKLGVRPLPLPAATAHVAARAVAAPPFLPPLAQRVEAASHPTIMDTTRAEQERGWAPRFSALDTAPAAAKPSLVMEVRGCPGWVSQHGAAQRGLTRAPGCSQRSGAASWTSGEQVCGHDTVLIPRGWGR